MCEKYWGDPKVLVRFEDVSVRSAGEFDCSTHMERSIEVYKENEAVNSGPSLRYNVSSHQ